MLRAGITGLKASSMPITLKAALVASIVAEASERGQHELELSCLDDDGKERMPTIKASFEVPKIGGTNNIIVAFTKRFTELGTYQFNLVIDRQEHDSVVLKAEIIGESDDNPTKSSE